MPTNEESCGDSTSPDWTEALSHLNILAYWNQKPLIPGSTSLPAGVRHAALRPPGSWAASKTVTYSFSAARNESGLDTRTAVILAFHRSYPLSPVSPNFSPPHGAHFHAGCSHGMRCSEPSPASAHDYALGLWVPMALRQVSRLR